NTGCQRRWLGPLRRTGKVPSDRRVADTGLRQGLAGTAPPAERNELVLLRDRAVEIRRIICGIAESGNGRQAEIFPSGRLQRSRREAWVAAVLPAVRQEFPVVLRRSEEGRRYI